MARGHPDYYGLPIFPKYGTAYRDSAIVSLTLAAYEEVTEILGQGRIYGGKFWSTSADATENVALRLYIDEILIQQDSFEQLRGMGLDHKAPTPLYLLMYDKDDPWFTMGIRGDLTFQSSIKLEAIGVAGKTVVVSSTIYYTLAL